VSTYAVIIDTFLDFIPCSSNSNRPFGEHIASIFRSIWDDGIPQLFCHGNTVNQALSIGELFIIEEHCLFGDPFTGGINYRCLLGLCSGNRRFGEHVASFSEVYFQEKILKMGKTVPLLD
jgi:hypothetical protein